jgi:hypothetical protein
MWTSYSSLLTWFFIDMDGGIKDRCIIISLPYEIMIFNEGTLYWAFYYVVFHLLYFGFGLTVYQIIEQTSDISLCY